MYEEKNIKESPFAGMAGFGGGSTGISLVKTDFGPAGGWVASMYDNGPFWDINGIVNSSDGIFLSMRSNGQPSSPYKAVYMCLSTDGTSVNWIINTVNSTGHNHLTGDCKLLSNGNMVVCGYTAHSDNDDYLVVTELNKTNGSIVRRIVLNGESYNSPKGLCIDSSDNYYVAGYYGDQSTGGYGLSMFYKFNSTQSLQWTRYYGEYNQGFTGSTNWNTLINCDLDPTSSDLVVCGRHVVNESTSTSFRPLTICKINSSGVEQWKKVVYGSSLSDTTDGNQIRVANNGYIYTCGWHYEADHTNGNYVINILTSTGAYVTSLRTSVYSNHNLWMNFPTFDIDRSTRDMYLVFYNNTSSSSDYRKPCLFKLNSNLQLQWGYMIGDDTADTAGGDQPTPVNCHLDASNDTFYFASSPYGGKCYVFKIPTTGLNPGTYGNYTVTDCSSLWGTSTYQTAPTVSNSSLMALGSHTSPTNTSITFTNNTNPSYTYEAAQEI